MSIRDFEIDGEFKNGLARAIKKDPFTYEKFVGFVSKNNEVIIPFKYPYQAINKEAQVEKDVIVLQDECGKYGVLDKTNELILNFEYEDIFVYDYFGKTLIAFKKNGFYGMTINGQKVLDTTYDYISIFNKKHNPYYDLDLGKKGDNLGIEAEIYFFKGEKAGLFLYDTVICEPIAEWYSYRKSETPRESFVCISKLNVISDENLAVMPKNTIVYSILSESRTIITRVTVQNHRVVRNEKIIECNSKEFTDLGNGFISISETGRGYFGIGIGGGGRLKNKGKDLIYNTINEKSLDLNSLPNGKYMIMQSRYFDGFTIEVVKRFYSIFIRINQEMSIVSNKKEWFAENR